VLEQSTPGLTQKKEMSCLFCQTPTEIFVEKEQSDDACKLNTTKDNLTILKVGLLVSGWAKILAPDMRLYN
jgi:hypothetical protein